MKVLLDTCVLSDLAGKKPNAGVVDFVDALDADDSFLSVLTIGEIIKGIEKLSNSARKTALRNWLEGDLLIRFQGRVLPVDGQVIAEWGALSARLENAGKPMPAIDSLIAATALAANLTLATRNVADFVAARIEIINPWK